MKPIDTLLFDLDGTLVDIDTRGIAWEFLRLVVPLLWDLMPPWRYYVATRDAVRRLKTHQSEDTNFAVMVATFARHARVDPEEIRGRVRRFEGAFERMRPRFQPVPGARETLLFARERGYRLGLATNPSTPESMVRKRLEWGGVADVAFEFITHSEIMTRSKPSPAYYQEILTRWRLDPATSLMIGNDPKKDLPAGALGIRTFLLERGQRSSVALRPDHRGTYDDLRAWLQEDLRLRAGAAERQAH